jgi:hypothetical protein
VELWLPWIEIIGLAIAPVLLLYFAFRRKMHIRKGLVMTARIVAVTAALPVWLFSLFLFTAQGCASHKDLIVSPDGRHAARLMIWGSVPSGSSVWVIERRNWSPMWKEVASGASIGTSLDPIEPTIRWADNVHLVLDFPANVPGDNSYGHECENRRIGDILVQCETHKGE